jgi:NAD(P)-dependent dehydrogenase (short-subunit alcohol dehydrogenase family)|nr:SDR family NAD(P)-dependent oxidoreductase [uncultured Azospirillum sp.]
MIPLSSPLAGQTVLVTGASGGIGAAIVERLAAEGARPVVRYGRDRNKAQALLDRIGGKDAAVADIPIREMAEPSVLEKSTHRCLKAV